MRENYAGYIVLKYEYYNEIFAIAIAVKKDAICSKYVTWKYRRDIDSFFWGHYFNNKREAIADYHKRLADGYKID